MEKTTATVYKCDFCNRVSLFAGGLARHEKFCKHNPKNRVLCYHCKHYEDTDEIETVSVFFGMTPYGEIEEKKDFHPNRCAKHDIKLFNGCKMWDETKEALLADGEWAEMPTVANGCNDFEKDPRILKPLEF